MSFVFVTLFRTLFVLFLKKVKRAILMHFLRGRGEGGGKQGVLLRSWKFFHNSARSHWFLRGHMTSNNETVSRQNL